MQEENKERHEGAKNKNLGELSRGGAGPFGELLIRQEEETNHR